MYFQKKGLVPNSIHADMVSTFGNDASALPTVQKLAAEFRSGTENLEDDPRSACFEIATSGEDIDRVYHMMMAGRQLTINQIANAVSISRVRVENMHSELSMTKYSARWMPRLVTPHQKYTS
eukprot:XP_014771788.1 PREDICTED: uncharacterized protein LOC106870282 [Octopus bimaculoides]